MASDEIRVVRNTRPTVYRILRKFRDERNPQNAVDITDYTIKLIVKNRLSELDAQAHFDLAAVLEDEAAGVYSFVFTTVHTCLPAGRYPGQIRWWSDPSPAGPPDDAIDVDFVVDDSVENYPL
jgi:hypothetical protein